MADLNAMDLGELYEYLSSTGLVDRLLELAREEDLGERGLGADVTSELTLPADARLAANLATREAGVIAGLRVIPDVIRVFEAQVSFTPAAQDGARAEPGAMLGTLHGRARHVLAIERTALNLVGRLSGVATRTDAFVRAIEGAGDAHVLDTRKTTPGLRVLEKYAVRCGGGLCHRVGLHDAVLVKDNHLADVPLEELSAHVGRLAREAWELRVDRGLDFVQIEVDSIAQLERVLATDAGLIDSVLLDNFDPDRLRQAVVLRDGLQPDVQLEASGGVTLDTVRAIAETGVERISVGSLTHHAVWLDVALDVSGSGEEATGGGGGVTRLA